MATHELAPGHRAVHWGAFDGAFPPALSIASGDVVNVDTLSGNPEDMPTVDDMDVFPEHREVHARVERGPGPHLMTGPIHVREARPGDTLRVDVLDVRLRQNWGWNLIRPFMGGLPEDFLALRRLHVPIDVARGLVRMPWGLDIPARPFFGVMGTAPRRAWGRLSSIIPRAFGGNMDLKELTPGSTLHLPVFEEGALFSVGDGHAVQGDGEVCLTAVETALSGRFRLTVLPGVACEAPWAETPSHLITLGFHETLDEAARRALRAMISLVRQRAGLGAEDAYSLCSLVADLRVTQIVNINKGVHIMFPKWALQGADRDTKRGDQA